MENSKLKNINEQLMHITHDIKQFQYLSTLWINRISVFVQICCLYLDSYFLTLKNINVVTRVNEVKY